MAGHQKGKGRNPRKSHGTHFHYPLPLTTRSITPQTQAEIILPKHCPEAWKGELLLVNCGKAEIVVQSQAHHPDEKPEISILQSLLELAAVASGPQGTFKGEISVLTQPKQADWGLEIVELLVRVYRHKNRIVTFLEEISTK